PEVLALSLSPPFTHTRTPPGSGYLTACLALMVPPSGHVLGVELVPQLAAGSVEALRKAVPALMADGTIRIEAGNVLEGLLASEPPFDAIHVGAAVQPIPRELVAALAPGGRMVVPVGRPGEMQVLKLVEKLPEGRGQEEAEGEGEGLEEGGEGAEYVLAPYGPLMDPVAAAAAAGATPYGLAAAAAGPKWKKGVRVTWLMGVRYVPLVKPGAGGARRGGR
ncbi:Protein-L-isoaspartate(D-aspartate) O-methyltransferase, partial [Tetrabaena socialis]